MPAAATNASSPEAWRDIVIAGRTCRIAGDPADRYFANAHNAARAVVRLADIGRAVLPGDGIVIDAGANIGLAALALAPLVPRGRVFAFEPVPATAAHLHATAALDPLANIECIAAGVGAAPGTLAIHVAERFSAGSHVVVGQHPMNDALPTIDVPVTTIDAFVAERGLQRLDLLKIDVEGFEAEVLDGAAGALARFRPVVHLEMNSYCLMCYRDMNPRSFAERLVDRFAHVFALQPDGARLRVRRGRFMRKFIHDHLLVSRGVQDLVCCMDDAWLARLPPVA